MQNESCYMHFVKQCNHEKGRTTKKIKFEIQAVLWHYISLIWNREIKKSQSSLFNKVKCNKLDFYKQFLYFCFYACVFRNCVSPTFTKSITSREHNLEVHIKTQHGRVVSQWDSSFIGLLQFRLAIF